MIELDGKRIIRIWAKHEPDPAHLKDVVEEMRELGRPTIRCVDWRGELYALEGSHRLKAAFDLGLEPNLIVLDQDRLTGEDEAFWEKTRDQLPDYCWEMVAEFQF